MKIHSDCHSNSITLHLKMLCFYILSCNFYLYYIFNNDVLLISGGQDFIETPHSFLFTPSQTEHCFDVCLINDDIYEVRQEFFVNLTSNSPGVTLSPQFSIIVVDDDDSKCNFIRHKM